MASFVTPMAKECRERSAVVCQPSARTGRDAKRMKLFQTINSAYFLSVRLWFITESRWVARGILWRQTRQVAWRREDKALYCCEASVPCVIHCRCYINTCWWGVVHVVPQPWRGDAGS
jgi:hypothetical protein